MARIAGVNVPDNKRIIIALTYIHGIGRTKSAEIIKACGLDESRRMKDLTEDEFYLICERFRSDHIWTLEGNKYKKKITL